jgi:hypothetical protein
MRSVAAKYALGPTRLRMRASDPRGWQEFHDQLAEHSAKGSANTLRGVQKQRPSLYDLQAKLERLEVRSLTFCCAGMIDFVLEL